MKVELHLSNYATKANLKNATSVTKKIASANLKSGVDKLDFDKLKNVPTDLSNLKNKIDKSDLGKLVPVFVALSYLSDVVKSNAKIKNIKDKIPKVTKFTTTTALTTVANKIPNVSNFLKNLTTTQKLMKLKKKVTDHCHDKYITTPDFKF